MFSFTSGSPTALGLTLDDFTKTGPRSEKYAKEALAELKATLGDKLPEHGAKVDALGQVFAGMVKVCTRENANAGATVLTLDDMTMLGTGLMMYCAELSKIVNGAATNGHATKQPEPLPLSLDDFATLGVIVTSGKAHLAQCGQHIHTPELTTAQYKLLLFVLERFIKEHTFQPGPAKQPAAV